MYGEGISKEGSILDMGLAHEVVQKSGAWFAYGEERLGQGRENAKQLLKDNDEVRARILADIHEKLGLDAAPDEASADGQAVEEPAGDPAGHFA
jgi:recombination protein RecA